jgi:hypothetical protein
MRKSKGLTAWYIVSVIKEMKWKIVAKKKKWNGLKEKHFKKKSREMIERQEQLEDGKKDKITYKER